MLLATFAAVHYIRYIYAQKRGASPVTRSTVERSSHCPDCRNEPTPIQRQISCNNQNDKKTRVNTNIYSI